MKRFFVFTFIFLLGVTSVFASDEQTKTYYENTNLRQKIGQMLIIGFSGTKLTPDNQLYKDLKDDKISGVILFSSNPNDKKDIKNVQDPKQLKKLISDIKKESLTKPFISIDEEGGKISRLPSSRGFRVKTLTHKVLGDGNDEMTTYLEAKKIAATLKDLGVNMNFAPCVDLALNPNSYVIYKNERSFSADPNKVIKHANAYILAHNQFGIMTVLKHFPGHGSTADDSHMGFTDASATWSNIELDPYKALISSGAGQNVMVSHVFNKKIDDKYPATLSYKTVTGILKNKLGFGGLIITDDIQMRAIRDNYTFEEAVINSINAGCDLIIIGNNLYNDENMTQKFNDTVFNAVVTGKIPLARIEEAYAKITKAKENL